MKKSGINNFCVAVFFFFSVEFMCDKQYGVHKWITPHTFLYIAKSIRCIIEFHMLIYTVELINPTQLFIQYAHCTCFTNVDSIRGFFRVICAVVPPICISKFIWKKEKCEKLMVYDEHCTFTCVFKFLEWICGVSSSVSAKKLSQTKRKQLNAKMMLFIQVFLLFDGFCHKVVN